MHAGPPQQVDPRTQIHIDTRRLRFRTRRKVDSLFAGEYESAFKGRGIEFAEVREYEPGDDVRSIDWNVTARTGTPFVKQYVEERDLTIMLLADLSASEGFGSADKMKSRLVVELCAALAMVADQHNDRVGLTIFTDQIEHVVPPKKGPRHVTRLMRELLAFRPEHPGTDLAEALAYAGRMLTRTAVVFVASDFRDSGYEQPLRALSHRHEVVCLHVVDPREQAVPAVGLVELRDPETGETYLVDTSSASTRRAFEAASADQIAAARSAIVRCHADHVPILTNRPFVPALVGYFRSRQMMRRRARGRAS